MIDDTCNLSSQTSRCHGRVAEAVHRSEHPRGGSRVWVEPHLEDPFLVLWTGGSRFFSRFASRYLLLAWYVFFFFNFVTSQLQGPSRQPSLQAPASSSKSDAKEVVPRPSTSSVAQVCGNPFSQRRSSSTSRGKCFVCLSGMNLCQRFNFSF
jgi:hypothetical protein